MDYKRSRQSTNTKLIVSMAIGLLLLIGLMVGLVVGLGANPIRTANLRDIVIVMLAVIALLTNIVISVLVASLIVRVNALVETAQSGITPILEHASQTLQVIRNTTSLVNENIAGPATKVANFLAKLRRSNKTDKDKVLNRFGGSK